MFYIVLALLFLGPVLRFGYQFGTLDHTILSLKGISEADPTAFVNDWFIVNSPQPHWLFDLYTQWGESLGLLREFYFVYWASSTTIFAWGLLLICRYLKIEKYAWVVAFLLLLAPVRYLGTGLLVGSWALPHFLGGALVILGCAFWLLDRKAWLWLIFPMTTLNHTQQGALLSLLLVGAGVWHWRKNWLTITQGVLNLVLVYATAKIRGVTEEGDFFIKLCKDIIPGHCYAPKWPAEWLLPLLAFFFVIIFYGRKFWKNRTDAFAALVLVATLVTFFGTLADYFDIAPFADIFRRLFMHRMAGFSLVFTMIVIVQMFFVNDDFSWVRRLFKATAVFSLAILLITDSSVFREERAIVSEGKSAQAIEKAGNLMRVLIPPGETITMDPRLIWVRLASRRAVIADTKAIPVQEKAFYEWAERYGDLGGGSFESLVFDKLLAAMRKYKSHYVLIDRADPKIQSALSRFQPLGTMFDKYVLLRVSDEELSKN